MLIGWTLGRYLSPSFLRTILAVFGTVFALVYTLDFVELMRRAGDAEGATPALMAQLALYRTPAVAEQIFPFAVLFGAMAALLQLSRRLELVVARAAGISAWQFLQPGMLVALTIGALSVAAYNPLSAYLKQKATEIEAQIFAKNRQARLEQGPLDPAEEPRRAGHHPGRGRGRAHDHDRPRDRLHLRRGRRRSRSASRPPRRRSGTATGS